jgi:large subunit ribosomal protein L18
MDKTLRKSIERQHRADRVRKKVVGTTHRPRLCVRRSAKHIYAQIIDDTTGKSLVQVGSAGKELSAKLAASKPAGKIGIAKLVGETIAAKAVEKGVTKVVFDRKGYPYHGRVKALADGARSKGLVF